LFTVIDNTYWWYKLWEQEGIEGYYKPDDDDDIDGVRLSMDVNTDNKTILVLLLEI
jgi:hypothetical protein